MKRRDFVKSPVAVRGGMLARIHELAPVLAALLLGLFGAGCPATAQDQSLGSATSSPAASRSQGKVWLRIMAFADAPLVGAEVRVSVQGWPLVQIPAATNQYGAFVAAVPSQLSLLCQFERGCRVTVSGGTINGEPFFGHLSADVALTDPAHQIIVINPVTTLISGLLDWRTHLDLKGAETRVRSFLTIPVNYPLGMALRQSSRYASRYFSVVAFMMEARAAGGLDAFVHLLLQELASDSATHSFRPPPLLGSTQSTATSDIQAGMEAGVLDYAGANNVANLAGWAMALGGFSTSGSSGDIDALVDALQQLQSEIQNLTYEVSQLTNLVQSTATQTQYIDITTKAQDYATKIQKHEEDLSNYASSCPPLAAGSPPTPPDPSCSTLYAIVLQELQTEDTDVYYEEVQNYVKDNGTLGINGMLHLYSLWLAEERGSFFRAADSTKMQNLYDYWDSILTSAANLRMEYYHLQGLQNGTAGRTTLTGFMGDPTKNPPTTGTFQTNEAANLKLMPRPVLAGTVVSIVDGTMWSLVPWQFDPNSSPCCGYIPVTPAAGCRAWSSSEVSNFVSGVVYVPSGSFYWDLSASIDDWKTAVKLAPPGTAWQQFLIDQTKTTGDETPSSPGFFNGNSCSQKGSWAYNWEAYDVGQNPWWVIFDNGQESFAQVTRSSDTFLAWPVHWPSPGEFYFYTQ